MPDNQFATLRSTVDPAARLRGFSFAGIPVGEVEILDMTPGMHIDTSREKRPGGSAMIVRNGRIRHDWVGRRPGTAEIIDNPDSDVVLRIFTVHFDNERRWLVRITKNNIYATKDLGGWGPAFTGPAIGFDRRVDATQFADFLYLSTPTKRVIKINFFSRTYEELDAPAPKAKYITSFADRVVVANVRDPIGGWTGTKLKWSGNGQPDEWDPLVDESAGEVNLDSAPGDYGDEVTGIFPMNQNLLILRERSVWLVERQPLAADPFRITPIIVGLGCDLPFTGALVPGGVMWADRRTRGVYLWTPGNLPKRLSVSITRELYEDIDVSDWVEGAYDPYEGEYHLGLNVPDLIVDNRGDCVETRYMTKYWVFGFNTKAWSYDVGPICSTMGNIVGIDNLVMIDELLGTIDEQVAVPGDDLKPNPDGFIDDWGYDPEDIFQPALYKGTPTGEVIYYTFNTDIDYDCFRFDFLWQSQNMGNPSKGRTLMELQILTQTIDKGRVSLEYSKNDHFWRHQKTLRPEGLPYRQRLSCKRRFTGDDIWWRITSSAGGFRMYEFWVRMLERARHSGG